MAFDRLFCPIKSHKSSRKSAAHHQATNRQTEAIQQSDNGTNQHRNHHTSTNNVSQYNGTNIPNVRYVTTNFDAVQIDELTVCTNDVVLYEFSDIQDGKNWSHVRYLTKDERGFVPSEILSTEPKRLTQCIKKKLPRSMADPSINHGHDGTHPHKTLSTSYKTCHSNGDSVKLQQPHHLRAEQALHFDIPPNSLQGSSGCQTVQKYPDWSYNHPGYYNLRNITEPQYERFNCRPFPRNSHGLFVVMHNFVAREESDLNVRPGDYVTVLNKEDSDWYWVRRVYDPDEGFVPSRFICPYEQVRSVLDKGNSTVTMKSSNQNDFHTYINHGPDRESLPTEQSSVFQQI